MNNKVPEGAVAVGDVITRRIGKEQIAEATRTLEEYKKAKARLDQRITSNEEWYRLRHWGEIGSGAVDKPASAWLLNCILNKHADAMDNYPAPSVLPREEGDRGQAKVLSAILPVVLEQNDFEQVYNDAWLDKLKSGTGGYGVFWDPSKLGGLGDIAISRIDVLNMAWEPGIKDIQKSRNLFHLELEDNDALVAKYPELDGKLGTSTIAKAEYRYDDAVDTSNKSMVIDWYYKRRIGNKTVVHYCKYVNDVVLYASENVPEYAERGFYDHGLYPFEFDVMYACEGTPTGFGYIDIGKSTQEYIDRGNQAIMRNMLANAKPRMFIRADSGINEAEYADTDKDLIHFGGAFNSDSVFPVDGKPLSEIYVKVIQDKVDELKETTGNRDISTGGTTSGVTAASAIAAMQEAGSKLSRDANKAAYRSFKRICLLCIELIRQFYDVPRTFRILGENGAEEFVRYSNEGIKPVYQGTSFGTDLGYRTPLFDVEVAVSKSSPYSKLSQNEMALQFYQAGFFNPQLADQALACLDMMDFDRKDSVMQRIAQNGGMYQQMLMMQQQILALSQAVDNDRGTHLTEAMAGGVTSDGGASGGGVDSKENTSLGGKNGEAAVTENARKRVANSTAPA